MRNLGALGTVVGAGLLVTLAACGGQSGGSTAAGSGAGLSVAPTSAHGPGAVKPTMIPAPGPAMPGVHLPAGATPVAGNKIDASGLPGGFPRQVWTTGGGSVLGFYGEEGGCSTVSASATAQTDTQVVLRLVQLDPPIGRMCPMYLRYKPMSVTIAKPLGTRTVVLQLAIQRK